MLARNLTGRVAVALLGAFMTAVGVAAAADGAKYPDWKGAWARHAVRGLGGQPSFDQTKPWGFGQEAPLTPEYRKVLEASLADQANGGQGNFAGHALCLPGGMPLMMIAFRPLEFVVTPHTTYVLIGGADHHRRIYTDGRPWPTKEIEPTFSGYSIGKWIDTDGDGVYDTLEVETRGPFKGPRAYDATGLPLAHDNQSIFKERLYRDKADPNILHDEITVIDNALTRPWTVDKKYVLQPAEHPDFDEAYCSEDSALVGIEKEIYWLGGDGKLMPARKDQSPPDLRHFKQSQK